MYRAARRFQARRRFSDQSESRGVVNVKRESLKNERSKTVEQSPVEDPGSSMKESLRDVLALVVLSIVSGGYLLWEVKDLARPKPKATT